MALLRNRFRRPGIPLAGASVAITGGAGGIGRALAEQFVAAGARVTIGDLNAAAARSVASEIGGDVIGVGLDVTDENSYRAFLDVAESTHGPLAVLVNNAGVDWMGPFAEGTNHHAERELAVNLLGPITGSRLALQRMLPRGTGHIVNVASGAGRVPQPGSAVYTGTKYGVVGFTECIALEYRDSGIAFSLLHPGYIPTAMTTGTEPSRMIPSATATDCARAVVDAVRTRRFNIFVPAEQAVAIRLGNILGRGIRDRVLVAIGVADIAAGVDTTSREQYHERVFGGTVEAPTGAGDRSEP